MSEANINEDLHERVLEYNHNIKYALQTVYDAMNQGQQKKILKDEKVKALFDKYGVEY